MYIYILPMYVIKINTTKKVNIKYFNLLNQIRKKDII